MPQLRTTLVLAGLAALHSCSGGGPIVASGCKADSECGDGLSCINGFCVAQEDGGATCGVLNLPCCMGTTCADGLRCADNVCLPPVPSDVGQPCRASGDCQSQRCIDVGNGQSVCSEPCVTNAGCVPGWSCSFLSGGTGGICQCTATSETCDAKDNDCNGAVDDGPAPNEKCVERLGEGATCQSGTCSCPHMCGGRCSDPQTDLANCGTCGNACAVGASCAAGECACPAGQQACDGVCVNTNTDTAHCGTCGNACGAGTTCNAGVCECVLGEMCGTTCFDTSSDTMNCGGCSNVCASGASCRDGQCACPEGQLACDGACIQQNIGNCGACGNACPINHDSAICSQGTCQILFCDQGFANCDVRTDDGCEVNLRSDDANCGGCGNTCQGGTSCVAGACVCPQGTILCNGVCVNPLVDNSNCGTCTLTCQGGTSCVGGVCSCPEGQTSCNSTCVDTATDSTNCGTCGITCDQGGSCSGGACVCPPGQVSCDHKCIGVSSDVNNCGGCHLTCSTNHANPACNDGSCAISSCAQGYDDCDHETSNGCEINLQGDRANCGACNNQCPATATCTAGQCKCPGSKSICNGSCVDTSNDVTNCGACGTACPSGAACSAGQCRCATGSMVCDGACTPVTSDVNNCGGCGIACPSGASCVSGQCACPAGRFACHGACVASDVTNCGACDNTCTTANGTPACPNRVCSIGSCVTGFSDCDRKPETGCEIDTTTDSANCGACGISCSGTHVDGSACVDSACSGTCSSGYANCDNNLQVNGCEIDVLNDVNNCGGCGIKCGGPNVGNVACIAGQCTGTCIATYEDCDTSAANGCETNLGNDPNNCGGCGTICSGEHMLTRTCGDGQCNGLCANGFADCNGNLIGDGCEVSTTDDLANCGGCNQGCSSEHLATTACVSSNCTGTCDQGYANCDSNLRTNGCETSIATDSANCGACGTVCSGSHVSGSACTGGSCTGTCVSGFADCNNNLQTDGCETGLNGDLRNCGACGRVCSSSNVVFASCSSGACTGSCITGYADCDHDLQKNGCEVDLDGSLQNCGACGAVCSGDHLADSRCVSGACTGTCADGYGDCNDDLRTDGCETHTAVDLANCGSCGSGCSGDHVINSACTAGACTGTCAPGWADCDSDLRSNGCETNIDSDLGNCGACNAACRMLNAYNPACVSGSCVATCNAGYDNCNGDMRTDGCETNLRTLTNCGSCGNSCAGTNVVGNACTNGVCAGTCVSTWGNCNSNLATDGCEAHLPDNVDNCGGCGAACSTQGVNTRICTAGQCASTCSVGFADCNANTRTDGCEISVYTDPNNCGGCGTTCSSNHVANRTCGAPGLCTGTCSTGFDDCNGDKLTDGCETSITTTSNCGTCGTSCSTNHVNGSACTSGQCTGTCATGYTNCNGNLQTDGCEANTAGDPDTCGGCNNVCSSNHIATRTCSSGTCNGTCSTGYADCNSNKLTDGCETSTTTIANCGGCGLVCSSNHIDAPSCSAAGVCNGSCNLGYADCNGTKQPDGCETDITTTSNCGACGVACSGSHVDGSTCTGGACTGTCSNGYGNCNNNLQTDGCETNIFATNNCGGCGVVCSTNHVNGSSCPAGTCNGTCATGYTNCNGDLQTDGCETNTAADPNNCGGCGTTCSSNHIASRTCASNTCNGTCSTGFADCNADKLTDGCETSTTTIANCGGCGLVCSSNHIASPTCSSGGSCNGTCNSGFADCNGNKQTDGCETDITTTSNCGGCGIICSTSHVTGSACNGTACTGTCAAGYANCNGNLQTDGCETNINATSNCGGCGVTCSTNHVTGSACPAGTCTGTCQSGYTDCNSNLQTDGCETNTAGDANNCGGCGTVCSSNHVASRTCTSDVCSGTCATGYADCNGDKLTDGCERSVTSDVNNCGGCNLVCSTNNISSPTCSTGGQCSGTCNTGFADCNGDKLTDGCETSITTTSDCGLCGVTCSGAHVDGSTCLIGQCVGSCQSGYDDCDNNLQTNGCETNLLSSTTSCGACGSSCSSNHIATNSCTAGTCSGTCSSGYMDCNSDLRSDGCETATNSDPNNCGGCGIQCSGATPTCSNGQCVSCGVNETLCNGVCVDLQTDVDNCGACGNSCGTPASPSTMACALGGCLETLTSALSTPQRIAVDSTGVYATDSGTGRILKVPVAGGALTTLASGRSTPTGIDVNGSYVFWTDAVSSGTVQRVPVGGGTIFTIASGNSTPWMITHDALNVYWDTRGSQAVRRGSISSGGQTSLATNQGSADNVVVQGTNLYWLTNTSSGNLVTVPTGGGSVSTLFTGLSNPSGIAADSSFLYWVLDAATSGVYRSGLSGGAVTTLVSGRSNVKSLAIDSSYVYWTELAGGVVLRAPIGGGTARTLATGQSNPTSVEVDGTSVYWISGTKIMRLTPK